MNISKLNIEKNKKILSICLAVLENDELIEYIRKNGINDNIDEIISKSNSIKNLLQNIDITLLNKKTITLDKLLLTKINEDYSIYILKPKEEIKEIFIKNYYKNSNFDYIYYIYSLMNSYEENFSTIVEPTQKK